MTVYAHLVNNEINGVYDLIPLNWDGIEDFRSKAQADESLMIAHGIVKIVRDTTPYDPDTHKMSDFPYYTVENGKVIEHRDISEIPPVEPETPQV